MAPEAFLPTLEARLTVFDDGVVAEGVRGYGDVGEIQMRRRLALGEARVRIRATRS